MREGRRERGSSSPTPQTDDGGGSFFPFVANSSPFRSFSKLKRE
jgi:hypothetical protein